MVGDPGLPLATGPLMALPRRKRAKPCKHPKLERRESTMQINGGPVRYLGVPYVRCRKCQKAWSVPLFVRLKRERRLL